MLVILIDKLVADDANHHLPELRCVKNGFLPTYRYFD
jgi:hypothetical protein